MSSTVGRRLLSVVVCVVLLALIVVVQRFVVPQEDELNPIATSGTGDAAVTTDDFTVEVAQTDVSHTLEIADGLAGGSQEIEANGVWVVVWARVTATDTPVENLPAELRMDDGTLYTERRWFTDAFGQDTFSPGIPLYGAFVFEVPEDRLDGPSLLVTNATGLSRRLGAQADIDLGMSDVTPADEPIILLPPEVQMGDSADAPE